MEERIMEMVKQRQTGVNSQASSSTGAAVSHAASAAERNQVFA